VRRDRWHELDVQSHGRDDGAAVRYAAPDGTRAGAFGWIGLGPDRTPLTDPHGQERRFRSVQAAKAAVDRAWP
jgi:hypothetical protein